MKKILILSIVLIVAWQLYASAPGGISSGLRMWLDASTLSLNNNDPVSSWTDQSGNGFHAAQATVGFQPKYLTNVVNGMPAIQFNTDDFLEFDGNVIVNTNYTIFAVVRRTSAGASGSTSSHHYFLGGTASTANRNLHVGWRSNTTFTQDQYSNEINTYVTAFNAGTEAPLILSARHSSTFSEGKDAYINGGLRGVSLYPVASRYSHMTAWAGASIGRYIDGTIDTRFNGWVAELIMYNRYLSDAERKSVETYLGNKYGITVQNDPSSSYHYSDWFSMQVSVSAPNASANGGGLTVDATFDTNFTRIRAAHNDMTGVVSNYNPNDLLYPSFGRLNRVWYMEVSGSNAIVDTKISFDLSAFGQSHFSDPADYRLLFKRCSCAKYEILSPSPVVNGNIIEFTLPDRKAVEHSGFYTLGTLAQDIPLPVELSSFSALQIQSGGVRLNWISQSETGLMGYYVFRSASPQIAEGIQVSPLIAAHNASTVKYYSFTDSEIGEDGEYYYWLQSMDYSGQNQFHGPVRLVYNTGTNGGAPTLPVITGIKSVFPNPFNPSTKISFVLKDAGDVQIKAFNNRGQMVKQWQRPQLTAGEHTIAWDADDLPSGIYMLQFTSGNHFETRKITLSK